MICSATFFTCDLTPALDRFRFNGSGAFTVCGIDFRVYIDSGLCIRNTELSAHPNFIFWFTEKG